MKINSANVNVILKACTKASKILIRDFGEIEKLQVSIKGPGDFVTNSDKRIEKIIIETLNKARPDYQILSEETGEINKNSSEYRWIIDPIDGTLNFMHGIPHFCISVALEHKNEIICGVIFDPIKDELFIAEKGNGAYLNNKRMRVSSRKNLKDSVIFFGGPKANKKDWLVGMQDYQKLSSAVISPIRKMGSAALDLAYVASGRGEGLCQRNLNYWDIAAGILMVKESGGIVCDLKGKQNHAENKTLLASNSEINPELLNLLN